MFRSILPHSRPSNWSFISDSYPSLYPGHSYPTLSSTLAWDKVHFNGADIGFSHIHHIKSEGYLGCVALTRNPIAILSSMLNFSNFNGGLSKKEFNRLC